MPDGTHVGFGHEGTSTLEQTMEDLNVFYQGIFYDAFETWAAASRMDGTQTELVFEQVFDFGGGNGSFGSRAGDSQGHWMFGDIRIGAADIDEPYGTLAHALFPQPAGFTDSGDIHLDEEEIWYDFRGF